MKSKMVGFTEKDLPVLNQMIEDLETRLSRIDNTIPTAEADETKFSHKLPIVISGKTYYLMMTES